jgi:hypothetical protein
MSISNRQGGVLHLASELSEGSQTRILMIAKSNIGPDTAVLNTGFNSLHSTQIRKLSRRQFYGAILSKGMLARFWLKQNHSRRKIVKRLPRAAKPRIGCSISLWTARAAPKNAKLRRLRMAIHGGRFAVPKTIWASNQENMATVGFGRFRKMPLKILPLIPLATLATLATLKKDSSKIR